MHEQNLTSLSIHSGLLALITPLLLIASVLLLNWTVKSTNQQHHSFVLCALAKFWFKKHFCIDDRWQIKGVGWSTEYIWYSYKHNGISSSLIYWCQWLHHFLCKCLQCYYILLKP